MCSSTRLWGLVPAATLNEYRNACNVGRHDFRGDCDPVIKFGEIYIWGWEYEKVENTQVRLETGHSWTFVYWN